MNGPDKSDVLAAFEILSQRGYGNENASAEEMTDMFCEILLERCGNKVLDDLSWGFQ